MRYTYFDLDPEYSFASNGEAQDSMSLIGGQLSYDFFDGGYLAIKYEHRELDEEPGTFALRVIGGYRF